MGRIFCLVSSKNFVADAREASTNLQIELPSIVDHCSRDGAFFGRGGAPD
jgi:hypothetical protein